MSDPGPAGDGQEEEEFTLEGGQREAARTLDRNVSADAGAGTGKTTTLTERYVTMLRAHLDGPETLAAEGETTPFRLSDDIEQITDPERARRLPGQIVVTTFTERAAEELKHSIREEINDRLAEIEQPERWELWRAAADGVETSYIHTIHGLCSRLLQEYATLPEAVDPNFEVLDRDEAEVLLETVVTELVEEEPAAIAEVAALFDRSQLQTVLVDLVSERSMTDDWLEQMESFDRTEYEQFVVSVSPLEGRPQPALSSVKDELETIQELLDDPETRERFGTQPMNRVGTELRDWCTQWLADIENHPEIAQLTACLELGDVLTKSDNERYGESTYFGNKGFRTAGDADARTFATAMERLLETFEPTTYPLDADLSSDKKAYDTLQALASLTRTASQRYQQRKERLGVLDYDDLIELATTLFANSSHDQLDALRDSLSYVMVDEFQDTNDRQWTLLKALVTGSEEFDADNVFVVGDEKQSIYRFRGGDVTVFEDTRAEFRAANAAHGTSDDTSQLATNFRTLPETLAGINGLFEQIFEYGGDGAFEVEPQPLAPGREGVDGLSPTVEYMPVPVEQELRNRFLSADHHLHSVPESEAADIEATAIASRIVELLEGDTRVTVGDDDQQATHSECDDSAEIRDVRPGDVTVLMRSRGELKEYERALRKAEVPYTVASGMGFFEVPEIRALQALLEALADPSDNIAMYAALRSSLCGLADEELAEAYDPSQNLWKSLQRADDETVQTAVEDMRRWQAYARTRDDESTPAVASWTALLDRILEETGYIAAVSADERGTAAVANVEKFRETLREYDDDGVPSLERVVARLDEQTAGDRSESEANVATDDEAVTLMTVHGAKGQEFPVVVVPGVGRNFRNKARVADGSVEFERVPVGDDREPVLGLKMPGLWGEDDRDTMLRQVAKEQRRAEEFSEEKRILYVACTRAEDHLILTGRHTTDDDEPTGVTEPNPEDPSTMRDWVQPALFGTDDEATASWETLEQDGQFTQTLEYERDGTQRGAFTVRLPPESDSYTGGRDEHYPVRERSSYTDSRPWELRASPSDLTGLADGSEQWEHNSDTRRVRVVPTEETERETSDEHRGGKADAESGESEWASAAVFGQAVHRLCEVRPPRNEWEQFINQVAAGKHQPGETARATAVPSAALPDIETAAERAVEFVDELHDRVGPQASYDEFSVTLTRGQAELQGFIDHLVVTEESYYIIDYKTDRKSDDETVGAFLDRRAKHHKPQVKAYAAALQEADPTRTTEARLFFTDVDEPYRWTHAELESATEYVDERIRDGLPDAGSGRH